VASAPEMSPEQRRLLSRHYSAQLVAAVQADDRRVRRNVALCLLAGIGYVALLPHLPSWALAVLSLFLFLPCCLAES
jgi:hypothetical protein